MAHLRIQALGPFRAWSVTDDGVWHPLVLGPKTWVTPALLTSIIFSQAAQDQRAIRKQLWEDHARDDEVKADQCFRKAVERARVFLGAHRDLLVSGELCELVGRDDLAGPRRVVVDWDDARQYLREKRWEHALSLMGGGLPLVGLREAHRVAGLISMVQEKASAAVKAALAGVDGIEPDEIDWARVNDFAARAPDDWQGRNAMPVATPASRRAGAELPTRRREPPLFAGYEPSALFEPCVEGEARLERELAEIDGEEGDVWWGSHQWFGAYVALWHRTLATPCEQVRFLYVDDAYDAARLAVTDGDKPVDAPKAKAVLLRAPKQLGDIEAKQIVCGVTNWGVAHEWAKDNAPYLLERDFSLFGIQGRPAYPSILGVHTLLATADGFLLFALRSPEVDFHERTWSASFEESVSLGPREFTGPLGGDATVLDPILGGLIEEWGIEEDAVRDSSMLAIGREWVREPNRHGGISLNVSPTIIAAARLKLTLSEVWESLDDVPRIRDREEHRAWAGCHFASRDAILRFVAAAKGRHAQPNLLADLGQEVAGVKLEVYPGSTSRRADRGLMPTSPARLLLGSAWLETC